MSTSWCEVEVVINQGLLKYSIQNELEEFKVMFSEYLVKLNHYLKEKSGLSFDFYGGLFSSLDVLNFNCNSNFILLSVNNTTAKFIWTCRGFSAEVWFGYKTGKTYINSYEISGEGFKEGLLDIIRELKIRVGE